MKTHIRNSTLEEYNAVDAIMKQVQQMMDKVSDMHF